MDLRQRLRAADGCVVGSWVTLPCAAIVEMSAWAGYDFVIVDMEHAVISEADLEHMGRAGDASGISVLVRVRNHQKEDIMAALDTGIQGVLIPMVESAEVAEQVVSAVHPPPRGTRSSSPHSRGAGYSTKGFVAKSTPFCAVEIESRKGVDEIGEIVRIPGLDMVFIGPSDLRLSLLAEGVDQSTAEARVAAAVDQVIASAQGLNWPVIGVPASHPKLQWDRATCTARGVRLATVGSDVDALASGLLEGLRGF
jgi:4-hydroxy-2-oxoheptanedioate aldolase